MEGFAVGEEERGEVGGEVGGGGAAVEFEGGDAEVGDECVVDCWEGSHCCGGRACGVSRCKGEMVLM